MKKFHTPIKNNQSPSKDQLIIYGRHAVISALKNPNRKIKKLLITNENKQEIEKLNLNISYQITEKKDIEKILQEVFE